MNYEETELRLGLSTNTNVLKRGYQIDDDDDDDVDLKLNLSTSKEKKRIIIINKNKVDEEQTKEKFFLPSSNVDVKAKPPTKAQVVGWPPVRSFRKNNLNVQRSSAEENEKINGGNAAAFVKVNVDGAPYLRKVDLKMYKSYQDLSNALAIMLSSFTIGKGGSRGKKDFVNESKLMDVLSGSDYIPTYQDKDGDWMLVGDVPWEMFVNSCKRLRMVKGKEAIGLAPRAMETCKNRN